MIGARMAPRRAWGRALALLAAVGLSACYTYAPLRDPEPQLGQSLAFELDQPCPEGLADAVGPDTKRVEGTLVRRTATDFVVSVNRAITTRGRMYRWGGETVRLPQEHVRQVRARHFSPFRTVTVAGGAVVSFVALMVTRTLLVSGDANEKTPEPKQGDGNVQ